MSMMYCYGCEWYFEKDPRIDGASISCPKCKSAKKVVKFNHPLAKMPKVDRCNLCNQGLMVKISEIHDPRSDHKMDLKRCQYCGHKQAYDQKKEGV